MLKKMRATRHEGSDLRDFYEHDFIANLAEAQRDIPEKVRILQTVMPFATAPRRIMEIGAGTCALLAETSRLTAAAMAIGCDLSSHVLSLREQSTEEILRCQCDAEALPFRDRSIDCVYSADVLEHLPSPDKALAEMARVGVRVVAYVPLERGILSDAVFCFRRFRGLPTNRERYGHLWRFDRRKVLSLWVSAGLPVHSSATFFIRISRFDSVRGRAYGLMEEVVYRLSSRLHEWLFGGHVFVVTSAPVK